MQRSHEYTQWSLWKKTEIGGPSRFGHLEGIRIGSVPKHLELLPYAVTRSRHIRPDAPGDPFNDGSRQDMRFGGDVKALLTSNLTLDATINPDFGQVEVDPAMVNLSAFETFFEEKRPFFVAGSGIFNFGNANCYFCSNFSSIESFYSRRIGRAPQGAGSRLRRRPLRRRSRELHHPRRREDHRPHEQRDHARPAERGDAPRDGERRDRRRARASSRRSSRSRTTSSAARRRTTATAISSSAASRRRWCAGSTIPRCATGSRRTPRQSAPTWCCSGTRRTISCSRRPMLSNVTGDSAAMMRVQRSSARYFQRPDRAFGDEGWFRQRLPRRVVPSRRDRSARPGDATCASPRTAATSTGKRRRTSARPASRSTTSASSRAPTTRSSSATSPTTGRSRRAGTATAAYRPRRAAVAELRRRPDQPRGALLRPGGTTPQFWRWNVWTLHNFQVYDDRAAARWPGRRARPPATSTPRTSTTDSRRGVVFNVNPRYQRNSEGGVPVRASTRRCAGSRRPTCRSRSGRRTTSRAACSSTSRRSTTRRTPRSTASATCFSSLVQKTLSMDTRLAVTFTPNSSLELYAQPFIATGDYSDFKEFDAPRQLAEEHLRSRPRHDRPDSRTRRGLITQLHGGSGRHRARGALLVRQPELRRRAPSSATSVYRWEYRPGSTLYLVWTQSRSDQLTDVGTLDFTRDRRALFSNHPDNIFLVKLNYWLGR